MMTTRNPVLMDTATVRHPYLLILALSVAESVAIFEGSMLLSTLATFYRLFGDPVAVGWVLTVFLLVSASVSLVLARLGDMFGRRRVILAVLVIGIIGTAISASSTTLSGIVFGRACQSVCVAITCAFSDWPTPTAMAPSAPCVEV